MRLPMPQLAPARLPAPIPKAVEVPWYDRGWEDVLENAAQGLQDVGGWIADHPGEIATTIATVVIVGAGILLSGATGGLSLAAVLALILVKPLSSNTKSFELELEKIPEEDTE